MGRGGAEHAHGHHCLGLDGAAASAAPVKAADGVVWLIDLDNPNQTERSGFTAASAKPGTVAGKQYDMYPERTRTN